MAIKSSDANTVIEHPALGDRGAICAAEPFGDGASAEVPPRNGPPYLERSAAMKILLTLKQLNAGEILSITAVLLMLAGVAYGILV
jgi:hypothetical protein